jgi:hypothetical protein
MNTLTFSNNIQAKGKKPFLQKFLKKNTLIFQFHRLSQSLQDGSFSW